MGADWASLLTHIGDENNNSLMQFLNHPFGEPISSSTGSIADLIAGFKQRSAGSQQFQPLHFGGGSNSPYAAPTASGVGIGSNMRPPTQPTGSQPAAAPVAPMQPVRSGPVDNGDDGLDHSSRAGFINSVLPYAIAAETRTGVPADLASLMIAINLNEQGWQNQAPGKNLFGIKVGTGWNGANTGPVNTWEDYGHGRENIQDSFRAYDNVADSYADFWNFLSQNPRYASALQVLQQTHDPEQFIRAVHAAGYATDPQWSNKIISMMHEVRAMRGSMGDAERHHLMGG